MYLCCYYCNFFSFSCSSFFIHLISIAMIIALRCWQSWWRWWYSKLFIFLFSFSILFFLSHPPPFPSPTLVFCRFHRSFALYRFIDSVCSTWFCFCSSERKRKSSLRPYKTTTRTKAIFQFFEYGITWISPRALACVRVLSVCEQYTGLAVCVSMSQMYLKFFSFAAVALNQPSGFIFIASIYCLRQSCCCCCRLVGFCFTYLFAVIVITVSSWSWIALVPGTDTKRNTPKKNHRCFIASKWRTSSI